jgi:hypothetical protein
MADLTNQEQHAESQSLHHRVYKWKPLHTQYCYESDGYLSFSSDGKGYWSCYTWTNDSHHDHQWHCKFSCYSHSGELLFETDDCYSPHMKHGQKYNWYCHFDYDSSYYDKISRVTQHYDC